MRGPPHQRRARLIVVLVLLASLAHGANASAMFDVTDLRTGQTFSNLPYTYTPYFCESPCSLEFTARQICTGSQAINYGWYLRDPSGNLIVHTNAIHWGHDPYTVLGQYTLMESEQTLNCTTGGTFLFQVVDRTPPETTITSPLLGVTTGASPAFTFTSSEPDSTFVCRVDTAPFASCTAPFVAPPLSQGDHTFQVIATDAAGNVDQSAATLVFHVQLPKPVASVLLRSFIVGRRVTRVRRLEVQRIPSGGTVSVSCRGKGCPYASRTYKPSAGIAKLTWGFRNSRLRAGAGITITVTAPEAIAKVYRVTARAYPQHPRVTTLCLPSGATTPSGCPR